jgi:hypothetical protein
VATGFFLHLAAQSQAAVERRLDLFFFCAMVDFEPLNIQ